MKQKNKFISLILLAVVLLAGCSVRTVDKMYCHPRRSEEYKDIQVAIDKAMHGLKYHAPQAGENQQTVQMADLDGDGIQEYLLFAIGGSERPLRILIFQSVDGTYLHTDTIESNGTAFDQVEYQQMDDRPGVEIIVGRQVDAQTMGAVSVYTFRESQAELLASANYTKFLTADFDTDGMKELFVIRPGQTETDRGIAEIYSIENGSVERSNEVNMSEPAEALKRVLQGTLHGGQTAVYIASAVGDTAIITDVYAVIDGRLKNITFSNETGTSVQTMRNYYVYADDIDNDGTVELPVLISMKALDGDQITDRHDVIRWYAMQIDGGEVNKMYTYHNFVGGWYFQLDDIWAERFTVKNFGNHYEFYLWNKRYTAAEKIMDLHILTGQNKEEQAMLGNMFTLYKSDTAVYAAKLEKVAAQAGITQESVIRSFHLIHRDWKTGET